MLTVQSPDRLELLSAGVFDEVSLVKHEKLQRQPVKEFCVLFDAAVTGDQQALLLESGLQQLLLYGRTPVVHRNALQTTLWKVLLVLVNPVFDEGGWAYHQAGLWRAILLLVVLLDVLVFHYGEGLQGLAETHIIAQGSTEHVLH